MKRFHFRLEQVRKWRQDQAELEEMRLEQLRAMLQRNQTEQREIEAEAERSRRTVLAQPSITADELDSIESQHEYAKQQVYRLKKDELQLKAKTEDQRKRVLEAHRQFELLDGLRDKALATWIAARDKEQEELGAELYLSKLARRPDGVK